MTLKLKKILPVFTNICKSTKKQTTTKQNKTKQKSLTTWLYVIFDCYSIKRNWYGRSGICTIRKRYLYKAELEFYRSCLQQMLLKRRGWKELSKNIQFHGGIDTLKPNSGTESEAEFRRRCRFTNIKMKRTEGAQRLYNLMGVDYVLITIIDNL